MSDPDYDRRFASLVRLGLSGRPANMLARHGFSSLEVIANNLTSREFARFENIGRRSVSELRKLLQDHGLSFLDERSAANKGEWTEIRHEEGGYVVSRRFGTRAEAVEFFKSICPA